MFYMNRLCARLKPYPTMMIPSVQIAMNIPSSFGFTAFRSIIIDGSESVVTAIIKDRTVPSSAPFPRRASATGIVPNISAYIEKELYAAANAGSCIQTECCQQVVD